MKAIAIAPAERTSLRIVGSLVGNSMQPDCPRLVSPVCCQKPRMVSSLDLLVSRGTLGRSTVTIPRTGCLEDGRKSAKRGQTTVPPRLLRFGDPITCVNAALCGCTATSRMFRCGTTFTLAAKSRAKYQSAGCADLRRRAFFASYEVVANRGKEFRRKSQSALIVWLSKTAPCHLPPGLPPDCLV